MSPCWVLESTMLRVVMLVTMAVLPGGLVLLAAWVLARTVVSQMRLEQGKGPHRLARAVVAVRWADVWRHARGTLRARARAH